MFNFGCFLLFVANSVIAQDFGQLYNTSNVIVNILDSDERKIYDSRAVEELEEQKWYIGGRRVQGDSARSETREAYNFPSTRDFYVEIQFPPQGHYITHVSCLVEQSSSIGRAYITDGGIGKDFMTIVFEAKRTTYFYYKIYLFGRNYQ